MSTRERPILFSAPMVRAILAGSKTQTRRVVKGMALDWLRPGVFSSAFVAEPANGLCPYGQPGDRLWVRETFQRFTDDGEVLYKADPKSFDAMNELKRDECLEARWRPAIHMPRTVSRITLEVSSIRVEPLQDISEADCVAEGVGALPMETRRATPRSDFNALWESINGPGSWEANPWVWVVGFNRLP